MFHARPTDQNGAKLLSAPNLEDPEVLNEPSRMYLLRNPRLPFTKKPTPVAILSLPVGLPLGAYPSANDRSDNPSFRKPRPSPREVLEEVLLILLPPLILNNDPFLSNGRPYEITSLPLVVNPLFEPKA